MRTEPLEARLLLAGDLTVTVSEGSLRVLGDRNDNQVSIATSDTGDLIVTGLNDTTVNGSADPFIAFNGTSTITRSLIINTYGGNDEVAVEGVLVAGSLVANTGRGNDIIDITSATVLRKTRIAMGSQDDTLAIAQLDASGKFVVAGHNGDDTIVLGDVAVTGVTRVRAGRDADRILVSGAMQTTDRFVLRTQHGADTVILAPRGAGDDASFGETLIHLGSSPDQLSIDSQSTFNGRLTVRGGNGEGVHHARG